MPFNQHLHDQLARAVALSQELLFRQREQWKHLTFVAYEHAARVELGAFLSELLYQIGRLHPAELAQAHAAEASLRDVEAFYFDQRSHRVPPLLAEIADPSLSYLWGLGTLTALTSLLALNAVHIWDKEHDLWNSPGYRERAEARRLAHPEIAYPPEKLSEGDWRLVQSVARAFPSLVPYAKCNDASYAAGSQTFVSHGSSIAFNPLKSELDAKRLAKKLHIVVVKEDNAARACIGGHPEFDAIVEATSTTWADASRLALTLCADKAISAGFEPTLG